MSLIRQAEQTTSAIPESFYEKLLRKCNCTKPAPLMMSLSDFSSDQTGPNLHYLIYRLLICVVWQIDVHVNVRVGVHSFPEVLHRDVKWSCHLNTSGLTRTMVPTQLFPWWPQLPRGDRSIDQVLLLPPLPVSARRARLRIHLIDVLWSPGAREAGMLARG